MRVERLYKAFEGKPVLTDCSFSFPAGETTAVLGPSGRGKTTLVKLMLGLLRPDAGTIDPEGAKTFAAVFQEDRLMEHLSARKNLRLAVSTPDQQISEALTALGLPARDETPVSQYSGGMRRRVAIARAVLADADVLILDEPFKGLDPAAREAAASFILSHCPRAVRILVTHDGAEKSLMKVKNVLDLGMAKEA